MRKLLLYQRATLRRDVPEQGVKAGDVATRGDDCPDRPVIARDACWECSTRWASRSR